MKRSIVRSFAVAVDEIAFETAYRAQMDGRFGPGILRTTRYSALAYLLLKRRDDDRVVAAAKFFTERENELYLAYIETAHDCKGQGFGRRLFGEVFAHAARNVGMLVISEYTRFGREYLAPREARLAQRYYPQLLTEYAPFH